MTKVLIITVLLGLLLFLVVGRLFRFASGRPSAMEPWGFREVRVDAALLNEAIKSSVLTGLSGFGLLLVILLLGMKIKILFILLPISIYLIIQLFVITNHLSSMRKVSLWYNADSKDATLFLKGGREIHFNLSRDVEKVERIDAVQKNRKILLGVYRFSGTQFEFGLSSLLSENRANRFFFDDVDRYFRPAVRTTLLPLV